MQYIIEKPKTESGERYVPMSDEVVACFKRILKDRVNPKVEPMVDGMTGFLFLDKNDMPMVALHWEKYFQIFGKSIIVYIRFRCRQSHRMYAGILIVQIWPIQG